MKVVYMLFKNIELHKEHENTSYSVNEQILNSTSKCHIRPSQSISRDFSFCLINNHFHNILRLFHV